MERGGEVRCDQQKIKLKIQIYDGAFVMASTYASQIELSGNSSPQYEGAIDRVI